MVPGEILIMGILVDIYVSLFVKMTDWIMILVKESETKYSYLVAVFVTILAAVVGYGAVGAKVWYPELPVLLRFGLGVCVLPAASGMALVILGDEYRELGDSPTEMTVVMFLIALVAYTLVSSDGSFWYVKAAVMGAVLGLFIGLGGVVFNAITADQ